MPTVAPCVCGARAFRSGQPMALKKELSRIVGRRRIVAEGVLSPDHLVDGELLDVWWTLWLGSRRRHSFHDPWCEGVEVSA